MRLRDARAAAQLYLIVQEALTNGLRHGGAREVSNVLSSNAEGGRLTDFLSILLRPRRLRLRPKRCGQMDARTW